MRSHLRPFMGLCYLLTVLLFLVGTILVFRHDMPWQRTLSVRLVTTMPGLELNPGSDVKFEGVLVGEVRSITSDGGAATIDMAIDPGKVSLLPGNVDAAIIPKTLFGEKYVDLRLPASPSSVRLAGGDLITQSSTSVELGAVFNQLVPILKILKPQQVSLLLSTLAQALDGRGGQLGQTLTLVHTFLHDVNPQLGTITSDLRDLAATSTIYANSAANLMQVLSNTTAISKDVLVPNEENFASFLDGVIKTATTATTVLQRNSTNLITLTGRAKPVLALLDAYSGELPCVISTLELGDRVLGNVVGSQGPWIQLSVDMVVNQAPYKYPQDLPSNPSSDANVNNLPAAIPNWNPHCPRLPSYITNIFPPAAANGPANARLATGAASGAAGPSSLTISEAQSALARTLAAHDLGMNQANVPPYVALLLAPLLQNGQVSVR